MDTFIQIIKARIDRHIMYPRPQPIIIPLPKAGRRGNFENAAAEEQTYEKIRPSIRMAIYIEGEFMIEPNVFRFGTAIESGSYQNFFVDRIGRGNPVYFRIDARSGLEQCAKANALQHVASKQIRTLVGKQSFPASRAAPNDQISAFVPAPLIGQSKPVRRITLGVEELGIGDQEGIWEVRAKNHMIGLDV